MLPSIEDFERLRPRLTNQARAIAGAFDADDAVQETFLDFLRHQKKLHANATLDGWFFVVNKHNAVDCIRRRCRRGKFEALNDETFVQYRSRGQDFKFDQLSSRAMQELPEHMREIIWLRYRETLSIDGIASRMGRTIHGVEELLIDALQALQIATKCGPADTNHATGENNASQKPMHNP